jgi:hypothetical protein
MFVAISRSFFKIKNVLDRSCRENQNTHFIINAFFLIACLLWENVENYLRAGGRGATEENIRRMRTAWWIPKAIDTHSPYVILIAIPLQQWLKERASLLRYKHIACLIHNTLQEHDETLKQCARVFRSYWSITVIPENRCYTPTGWTIK